MSEQKEKILQVRNLDITFHTTAGDVHAIRGVNIDLYKGNYYIIRDIRKERLKGKRD